MEKGAPVNGHGRTPTERITLLEAKVGLMATVLKWLIGGVVAALAKILWDTLKP